MNPLGRLDRALLPAVARGLRRTVDAVRSAPGDAGRGVGRRVGRATRGTRQRTRRLDERHARTGVLGFVHDLPQAGFVAVGVLVVVGALAIVRIDTDRTSGSSGGTPAASVSKGCPVGALPAGQGAAAVGPTAGQPVAAYLQKTAADLAACAVGDGKATFYAVISFDALKTPADVAGALNGTPVLQVFVDLPGATAAPRVLPVTGPDDGLVHVADAIRAAYVAAAVQFEQDGQLQSAQASSITPRNATELQGQQAFQQAAALDASQAHDLRTSCACAYGAVVRAPLSVLASLRTSSVRAIALAPAGTQPAGLSARPLLPSETAALSDAAAPSTVVAGSL